MFDRFQNIIVRMNPAPPSGKRRAEAIDQDRLKPVGSPVLSFSRTTNTGNRRGQLTFEPAEYDFDIIDAAASRDGIIRQAFSKLHQLMFKEGWFLSSKNEQALDYLYRRLDIISEATGITTQALFSEIGFNLVKYHNAFVVKARDKDALAPVGYRIAPILGKQPVAGYFLAPVSTIEIARDANGDVLKYRQNVPGSSSGAKEFDPADMIHFYVDRPTGRAWGEPFIIPVLDDVRLLREVEDNVARLQHQSLHPIYDITINGETQGAEALREEIELIRNQLRELGEHGVLIKPSRYTLDIKGVEDEVLDVEWFVIYLRNRVFAGLGIPALVFGLPETANRSTAEYMMSLVFDRVKHYQKTMAEFVQRHIFYELLLEAGFDPILNPDDRVTLEWNEIDFDAQIKRENHVAFKWDHAMITWPEMRRKIGEEVDVDINELQAFKIRVPVESLIRGGSPNGEPTPLSEGSQAETDNLNQPQNQSGRNLSPRRTTNMVESVDRQQYPAKQRIMRRIETIRGDLMELAGRSDAVSQASMVLALGFEAIKRELRTPMIEAVSRGVKRFKQEAGTTNAPDISLLPSARIAEADAAAHFDKLRDDWLRHASDAYAVEDAVKQKALISGWASTAAWRAGLILDETIRHAERYGYALAAQAMGRSELVHVSEANCCPECQARHGQRYILQGDLYSLTRAVHPGCKCHQEAVVANGAR